MKILDQVWDFCIRQQLILPGQLVIAGLSGGPDSVALLHILLALAAREGFSVHAAHVNHLLRDDALQDEEFVRDLCAEWKVPLAVERIDVAKLAREQKQSIEEAGRNARYKFFEEVRQHQGAISIAVAHHRQDQAETILMRLIQGTGLGGLQGILPRRGNIIRPILTFDRENIINYLSENGLPYRIDYSNYDKTYLRNRIRLELIPQLQEDYNPDIVDSLCRLAQYAQDDNRYWDSQIDLVWDTVVQKTDTGFNLFAEPFSELSKSLQDRLMQRFLITAGGRRVSHHDIARVMDLAVQPGSSKKVQISGGVWVGVNYGVLQIPAAADDTANFFYELAVPGETYIPEIDLWIQARLLQEMDNERRPNVARFDWGEIEKPLYVRSRIPGDRFQPPGLDGTKKVKDYFIENKIPVTVRNQTALLASDREIYWLMGLCHSDKAQVNKHTQTILEVEINKGW
ncbi:MAG: tRNA lysidine(34) synthetase TilS [Candidatus Saccharibacteria bacterium]